MLDFYQWVMSHSQSVLNALLQRRLRMGKEDQDRIGERRGVSSKTRPDEKLVWLHAASVGEAQSALILINALLTQYPNICILVTTGTLTSAKRMQTSLPERALHQFIPLDHPDWVERFIDFWNPDLVFWMESELWPNLLLNLKSRQIPTALINARLSDRSYRRWKLIKNDIQTVLSSFDCILAQTEKDAERLKRLSAKNVIVTDNLKYSAASLPYDAGQLTSLKGALNKRQFCVYASTHKGEEEMIARIHKEITAHFPDFLSIIIPRHPERGRNIYDESTQMGLECLLRGDQKYAPTKDTEIYIADTLGELGLFYALTDIAYIGRSLSADGGGGHNPIEAAQLDCAIIHGSRVQNLQEVYDDMKSHDASIRVVDEKSLSQAILNLLQDQNHRKKYINNAKNFANAKSHVIDSVMQGIEPLIKRAGL